MGFAVKINLFKYKRFKDGTQGVATKKKNGSSHLNTD